MATSNNLIYFLNVLALELVGIRLIIIMLEVLIFVIHRQLVMKHQINQNVHLSNFC